MISTSKPAQSDLRTLAQQLPQRNRQAFLRMVTRDIVPAVNSELTDYLTKFEPPARTPSSPKFVWSRKKKDNDKARRWWFWAVKKGKVNTDGSNYIRTGKLRQAWLVSVVVQQGVATISVQNKARGAKYVYGNQERPQIPGHRVTGWPSINRRLEGKRRSLDSKIGKAVTKYAAEVIG